MGFTFMQWLEVNQDFLVDSWVKNQNATGLGGTRKVGPKPFDLSLRESKRFRCVHNIFFSIFFLAPLKKSRLVWTLKDV